MKYIYTILYICICIFLFTFILKFVGNNYIIVEPFSIYSPYDINSTQKKSHTVNLPINTVYSCQNMCGPNAQCSITREQCTSDIDCYGCKPPESTNQQKQQKKVLKEIVGQNEAGKLTGGFTPTYSVLTTDIGTRAKLINNKLSEPPQYDSGINTWRHKFDMGQELFDKRYYTGSQMGIPVCPKRKTLSGEFIDDGPLAANAFL
jgi:hypothetical protein